MRWLVLVTTLLLAAPAAGQAHRCLRKDVGQRLMDSLEVRIDAGVSVESVAVSKETVQVTFEIDGKPYGYRGVGAEETPLAFAPVTQRVHRPDLQTLLDDAVTTLGHDIWSPCGDSGKAQSGEDSGGSVRAHDLSDLPPDACRPTPGYYCYDEYWTLPPRWGFSGALVTYLIHLLCAVWLVTVGVIFLVRVTRTRQRP